MKKYALLFLALALVIGCLVAFSSCGECEHVYGEEPSSTVAATCEVDGQEIYNCTKCGEPKTEVLTKLGHSWDLNETIDVEATCNATGSKSIHCLRSKCSAKKDETEIPVDPTAHVMGTVSSSKAATVFTSAEQTGTCTLCQSTFTETLSDPVAMVFNTKDSADDVLRYTNFSYKNEPGVCRYLEMITKEKFYPTEAKQTGNDLLVEFTLLYTEEMKNLKDTVLAVTSYEDYNLFNIDFKNAKITAKKRTGDIQLSATDNVALSYGWHRIAVRYHQEASIVSDQLVNKFICTLYLDGEEALKMDKSAWVFGTARTTTDARLFTTKLEGGKIVYGDIDEGKMSIRVWFEGGFRAATKDIYFAIGDVSISAGTDFKYSVSKLATPEAGTFTFAEGKTVSVLKNFKYN